MHKKALLQLKDDIDATLREHPGLQLIYKDGRPHSVGGQYNVKDDQDRLQDTFEISVPIPEKYPYEFPILIETAGRIKCTPDRHMGPGGRACVELTHKQILVARQGISLRDFFRKYVHKYFCWQILYELVGPGELEEWPHEEAAVIVFYRKVLNIEDAQRIKSFLQAALLQKEPSLNRPCPCNSGKLFKRCHEHVYYTIKSLGMDRLTKDLAAVA